MKKLKSSVFNEKSVKKKEYREGKCRLKKKKNDFILKEKNIYQMYKPCRLIFKKVKVLSEKQV